MLKSRLLSVVVTLPIMLAGVILGGVWLLIVVTGLMLIATYEYVQVVKHKEYHLPLILMLLLMVAMAALFYFEKTNLLMGFFIFSLFCLCGFEMFHEQQWSVVALSLTGLLYIGIGLGSLFLLDQLQGTAAVVLALGIAWLSDTGGYVVGRLCGKHQLFPVISPKKTIEGAIGGVVFAVITVFIISALTIKLPLLDVLILGILGSMISQLGDLTESLFKRSFAVKDAGTFLPGHGGILDRFDSVILVAPFVYYYLLLGV